MNKLAVIYKGWGQHLVIGTLAEVNKALFFEYSPEALQAGIEFSPIQMPLASGLFEHFPAYQDFLPGFIADSLPDGWGRLLTDRFLLKHYGLAANQITPLQRLALVGERAIGALAFQPAELLTEQDKAMDLVALANEIQVVVADKAIPSSLSRHSRSYPTR